MLKLLDRKLVLSFVWSYLGTLFSLLALFIVVDLFTHLDDFTSHSQGFWPVMHHIAIYYGQKSAQIYDRLSEAIILLAAMFTVAWVQKNNELLPLLSAGVSTRRVVMPVLVAASAMLGLAVLNQELLLPNIDGYLLENRDDPEGQRAMMVKGGYEPNGIHLTGRHAFRQQLLIQDFNLVIPPKIAQDGILQLKAKEARYQPPGPGRRSGGWLLTGAQPPDLDHWTRTDILEPMGLGKYFLRVEDVDFDTMTRQKNWFMFVPTWQLLRELYKTDSAILASVAVIFHTRLTRPLLGMILLFLGLSIILRDQNRNVFISAGLCLGLCAVFFAACFACKFLGDYEQISPALAAWLPVLVFGPLAFVLFDAIHT